jgi:hypothetical protein
VRRLILDATAHLTVSLNLFLQRAAAAAYTAHKAACKVAEAKADELSEKKAAAKKKGGDTAAASRALDKAVAAVSEEKRLYRMFREAEKLLEEVIRKATAALAAPTPQAHHGVAPLTVSAHRVSQWLAAAPASAASADGGLLAGKPSYARFQLEHFGPWLPRPRGKPDARVQFPLDTWQVRVPFLHGLVMTVHFIALPFFGV